MAIFKTFEALGEAFAKIEKLPYDVLISDVLKKHEKELSKLNTEQLDDGVNQEGGSLPNYALSTKKFRAKLGLKTSPMDLKVTGLYHKSIKPNISSKDFKMISEGVEYSKYLKKFNPEGLTDESLQEFIDTLFINSLINKVKSKI